ncbi:ABC transporter permease [Roseateles cavernae]|uniref:ABC transporter permease n=1 Tax=Roseateles cavernae TaxID=3153578 RepID=UPI0032E3B597
MPHAHSLASEAAAPAPGAALRPAPGAAWRLTPAWRLRALSIVAVLTVLLLWQLSGSLGWVDALLLPPPAEVLRTVQELLQQGYRQVPLWQHVAVSVGRALAAFAAAVLIGVPLGLAMGLSSTLSALLNPFVQFLRPLPKIALIPLVVVWLGIGEGSKFFLIFISTGLSVVVSAAAAAAAVPQGRLRAAQVLGASRRQLFSHVVLPHSLPELFTGVRLSVGVGWTSLIAAEMVAATSGLGWMVLNASAYLRTDIVMLGILLLGFTGWAFDWLLLRAQRRFVPWAGKE